MKIYVVGGAIRDQLMGLPIKDLDYVVVGASPQEMIQKGFIPVGQDFPVFLHPVTRAEYALARTERKVSPGYKGFVFHAAPEVTLEQDLARRDLTINAMARLADDHGLPVGDVIDPYGGQEDIRNHVFRHVGPSYKEDPVRLLRLARFAARFPDFQIHATTLNLLKEMKDKGELEALVKERVWQEISRGLMSAHPARMFEVFIEMEVLELFFPKLANTDSRNFSRLNQAAQFNFNLPQRYATLTAGLDLQMIAQWAAMWSIPAECKEYAVLTFELRTRLNQSADAEDLLNLLDRLDVWRKPERFSELMVVARLFDLSVNRLIRAYELANQVNISEIVRQVGEQGSSTGTFIKEAIHQARMLAIKEL